MLNWGERDRASRFSIQHSTFAFRPPANLRHLPKTAANDFTVHPSNSSHPHDFLEARDPLGELAKGALAEGAHAALDGHVLDLQEVLGAVHEVADGVVDGEDLEDPGAAEVAGV